MTMKIENILRGKKIWKGDATTKDVYVDFVSEFKTEEKGRVYLRISCDSNYTAYVNGKIAGFAQCADYPHYRNFDKLDITRFCEQDKANVLKITVWHYGVNSLTYINADAFLLFDVIQGGKTLLCSDQNVRSAINEKYKNGYLKQISSQLGLSFLYDANVKDGKFGKSEVVGEGAAFERKRGICRMKPSAAKAVITKENGGYLVDLGRETVGFISLDFKSDIVQKITISYGERKGENGNIPRFIGDRDFSVEYIAKKGENSYINTFRRLAGRYLFVECEKEIDIKYIGIRPVEYPVRIKPRKFKDKLLQKIYDVSVYTIRCCMHEHYEDCPWREQAFYAMDSRNQMLCNYYMFDKTIYQRENLVLMSKGLRADGLLSLCFPAGNDFPIPLFSLVYIMQTYEYIKYTGDVSVLEETGGTLDKIMETFTSKIADNRLIAEFPAPYWNFYEWAEASANDDQIGRKAGDVYPENYSLILNCMFAYVAKMYGEMRNRKIDTEDMLKAIRETFYVPEKNAFRLSTLSDKLSVLGNSLAVLAGVGDEKTAERLVSQKGMIPITLSMNAFRYDALLLFGDKYKKYIIDDIRVKYGEMLEKGATTFWETELGGEDFGGAGSMCHGWSAIPVYYLATLVCV